MKKTKRSKTQFPGLDPSVNSRKRWEYMDQDYIDQLTDKEKEWLSNFNEEFIGANLKHKGKIFHKSKKDRKACYDRNNARNRDLYSLNRTGALIAPNKWIGSTGFKGQLEGFQKENISGTNLTEDNMIDELDKKDEKSSISDPSDDKDQ